MIVRSGIFSKTGLRNRIRELNLLIKNQREQIEKKEKENEELREEVQRLETELMMLR
jgi:cell division protein FtsB